LRAAAGRATIGVVAKRPKTERGERRARARAHAELVNDLERLAALQPGGTPERPLVVASPTQVDIIAQTRRCPLCEGSLELVEHAAERVGGVALRAAHLRCVACGVRRTLWFRLGAGTLH
jgi:hypothetical protein